MNIESYVKFSRPFIDALKETFKVMVSTDITPHSPRLKSDSKARGEITAMIGMNGVIEKNGQQLKFNGLIALSFSKEVYLKIASAMMMQEFTDYHEDMEDTGAEIANIVMGNAKKVLAEQGYKIGMSTPTRIKGKDHEIKYPSNTVVVETTISSDHGEFTFDICYQEA
jgi:chemotaxis protein CheX